MNIKNKINRKSLRKDDISCIKFNIETVESFLEHKTINVKQYADMIEFKSANERGGIEFFAYKHEGYKVQIKSAFAKLFDFESEVNITGAQMDRLQSYVNDYLKDNPFDDQESDFRNYDPYFENGVKQSDFYA